MADSRRPSFLEALHSAYGGEDAVNTLIDEAPFNVIIDRTEGGVIYANQTQLRAFNMTWEEFRGYGWARSIHPADSVVFQTAANEYLSRKTDRFDLKYRILRPPDQETIWLHANVRAIEDSKGVHLGNFGVSFDVTEQEEHHERAAHTQKMEAVGRLSGRIAHDFNNLLGVMLACIDMMNEEAPDTGAQHRQTMLQAVDQARQITTQLLALARPRGGARICYLDDELARLEPLIARTVGEHITYQATLDAGAVTVPLDSGQIGQIMLNLASNARDAMRYAGRLEVRTEVSDSRVVWTVEDDGAGMEANVLQRAREAFFTTKSPDRGTGLGLAMVADLVAAARGELTIDSEPGRGTRVVMTIPTLAILQPQPVTAALEAAGTAAPGTLLVVEDHDGLRQSLAFALSTHGYRVLSTGSVQDAVRMADEIPELDALITDMNLRDGQGTECAAKLRAKRPNLPVVYTSGFRDGHTLQLGANEVFLSKPLAPRELLRALNELTTANALG